MWRNTYHVTPFVNVTVVESPARRLRRGAKNILSLNLNSFGRILKPNAKSENRYQVHTFALLGQLGVTTKSIIGHLCLQCSMEGILIKIRYPKFG